MPRGYVHAAVITTQDQTTGGPSGQGRPGDYVLENDYARFVVQSGDGGRVFGLFGGSLLDGDVRRDSLDDGNDQLMETFSLVDFYVSDATRVEVIEDGSSQTRAVVRVTGHAVPFPMLPPQILDIFSVPGDLDFDIQTDYVIYPNASALEIVTTVTSRQDGLSVFQTGDALITGLQDELSGGDVASWLTTGTGVSYAYSTKKGNEEALAISGVGLAIASSDVTLGDGATHTYRRWFSVGGGGAASALAPLYELRGVETGTLEGTVADAGGQSAATEILVEDSEGRLVTTMQPDAQGGYSGPVEPGEYHVYARANGHEASATQTVTVSSGATSAADFTLGEPGRLQVAVTDSTGAAIPAKVTLFPDAGGSQTRFAPHGSGVFDVVPGSYRVVVSRGFEYTVSDQADVVVTAGQSTPLEAQLERVVDTTGWVAADFHLHAQNSTDSVLPNGDRLATLVAEGVEFAAATDHDFLTDYEPVISELGLDPYLASAVGVETSTWLLGHFNGWPMVMDPDTRGRGAPVWFNEAPADLFQTIRAGLDSGGVLQVNHPRMTNSYFDAIGFNPATGQADADPAELGFAPSTDMLSLDFDAVEVFNGKRVGELFGDPNADPPEPGAINDWFAFLNMGQRFTFTGNSDSHSSGQEVGYPRNYVGSATDDPAAVDAADVAASIRAHHNIVSGGPFVTAEVRPAGQASPVAGIGDELAVGGAETSVDLSVRIQAPPWMDVTRFHVYRNGSTPVMTVDVPASLDVVRYDDVVSVPVSGDSWIVVQVEGDVPLDPVVPGGKPLSFTNPVWVDVGGDGFTPPGL